MKTLVKKAALDLIQRDGTTTTLDVKNELIATEPQYFWKQSFVSAVMDELAQNGELVYRDTGIFRIYELPSNAVIIPTANPVSMGVISQTTTSTKYRKIPISQRSVKKVPLTELARLVQENAGKFITVVHKKKTTNDVNVMNCQILKDVTPLGAFKVKEKGQLKTFYPTDLLEVRLKSTVYKLK